MEKLFDLSKSEIHGEASIIKETGDRILISGLKS